MPNITSSHNTKNLVNIKSVLQDIYRIVEQRGDIFSEDDMIESASAAASHLFNYKFLETAICIKCVDNHKVVLDDYYDVWHVMYKDCLEGDELNDIIQTTKVELSEDGTGQVTYNDVYDVRRSLSHYSWNNMTLAHSIAGMVDACADDIGFHDCCNYTYSVKGDVMSVSPKDGYVIVVYRRILRDEDGDLLIPNIANVNEAIRTYVLWEMHEKEFNMHREGSVSRVDRYFARWQEQSAAAMSELMMPSLPEYVSMVSETNRYSKINDDPSRLHDYHYGGQEAYFGNDSDYYRSIPY